MSVTHFIGGQIYLRPVLDNFVGAITLGMWVFVLDVTRVYFSDTIFTSHNLCFKLVCV